MEYNYEILKFENNYVVLRLYISMPECYITENFVDVCKSMSMDLKILVTPVNIQRDPETNEVSGIVVDVETNATEEQIPELADMIATELEY